MPTTGGTQVTGGIVEYVSPARHITCTAGGTIAGGNLVALTGNRTVQQAGAASATTIGVALHDALAGEPVTVATHGVWPMVASGALTAGARLVAAAAGQVSVAGATPDARTLVGVALEAVANGATGRVYLGGSL